MADTPEPKTPEPLPVDGNYRIFDLAENGAPLIQVGTALVEAVVPGGVIAEKGNFAAIVFDIDRTPHVDHVI